MIINYSTHSLKRIRERGLSKEIIGKVISNPERLVEIGELKKAFKKFDDSVIVVVYKDINNIPFIITVSRSTDTKRYLK